MEKKGKVWLGIDPGKSGSIAGINEEGTLTYYKTPTIGKEYDKQCMVDLLKTSSDNYNVHVVLENINSHSALGRQSAFVMGKGVALWEMALVALKIPHTMINPKIWQKEMWQGIQIQKKGKKKDAKSTSLLAAKRLFPNETFLATERSSVPHDGIVDAVLMAEFCRRKFK